MVFNVSKLETEPIVLVRGGVVDPYIHDAFFSQYRFYEGDHEKVFEDRVNSASYYELLSEMSHRSILLNGDMASQDAHYNANGKLMGLLEDLDGLKHEGVGNLKKFVKGFLTEYLSHDDGFYHRVLFDIESTPFFMKIFSKNKINNYPEPLICG